MTTFSATLFPRRGARKRTPGAAHSPFPAPRAGVTGHLSRLAGEDGWRCSFLFRASADGTAEAP